MRILQVTDFFPPVRGGLEFHVDELASELSRRGHEVHIATLTPDPVSSHPDVIVHTIPSSSWLLPRQEAERPFHPPIPDPIARHALRRVLSDIAPDIIHGHNWLAVSLPRHRSAPFVYTAHDYGQVCQLRTLLKPSGQICEGPAPAKCLACGSATYGGLRSALLAPATALGRRLLHPEAVIAVGNSVAHALAPWIECPVSVVHNFLADPGPAIVPPNLPEDFFVFAGDPRFHKGLDRLLQIWTDHPPDASLVLALTRPTHEQLPAGVQVLQLNRRELLGTLSRAKALLVPSRWPDPCPSVIFEAFSVGTPVIATQVGGLPDLIRSGVDGLLVGEPEIDGGYGFERCVKTLLHDEVTRAEMSAQALLRSSTFASAPATAQIEAIYRGAIDRRAVAA